MGLSKSGEKLRLLIHQAIEDGKITAEEYDAIIELSHEDGHVDHQEKALLKELQQLIENKTVIFTNK